MSGFFSHFQFGQALFFALLVLLPLLWLGRRRLFPPAILWRSIVLLLLIFALADPRETEETHSSTPAGEAVFAFDLSRSVPGEMRLWMARQNIIPRAGDRVFIFGGAVEEVKDWESRLRGEASIEGIKPEQTNLEALFSTLLSLPRHERSVFLFTDGWQTEGDAERLLPSLAQAGIKVYPVLPPERPAAPNVAVKKIVAPNEGAKGEAINLKAVVENNDNKEIEGSLILKRNGQPLKSEPVRLKPGSHMFSYQTALGEGPLLSYQAEFSPRRADADRFPQDNQATAWVAVQSKEKVLLLNGRAGEGNYLEEMLKRHGFDVTSVVAGGSPPSLIGYGVVILNNVQREVLSPDYLGTVERQVSAGNGLLVLGDENGLPPGGYRRTPVGPVLPVEVTEPQQEDTNRAVLLVIDKSTSMDPSENRFKENRLLYAKRTATALLGQLREEDFIGVIAVDTRPSTIVPMVPVKKARPAFGRQMDGLIAKGNSYLLPGLEEAMKQLHKQPAGRKHVILLTDADEIRGNPSEYIDLVTYMKTEGKIRVSAVGIGNGVNEAFIKRIATYGDGVPHIAKNLSELPQIVFQLVAQKAPEAPRQQKDFVPAAARGSEILVGLPDSYPPVKGYVETELKKGARLDLSLPRDGKNSPLLASWRYGKGRAAVFTADQAGRWSKDWILWAGLERFWGKVFDWLRPEREMLPAHEARINLVDHRPVLDFYLYSQESDGNIFRYSFSGSKGAQGDGILKRVAPGHYRSELPFNAPGDYRVAPKEERRGRIVDYPIVGYTLPVKAKGDVFKEGFNLRLLEEIARSTGGTINPGPEQEQKTEYTAVKVTFLRSYFIFLAALLFLMEVFFRRFFPGEI
jgi:Ca-activated chloride channel family protein